MFLITTLLTKASNFFINLFRLGSGLTWPGHLALKMFPRSLTIALKRLPKGYILISGTNGKTTTSKLISHVLQGQGMRVVSNKSGANLLNGILSALLLDTGVVGKPRSDIGVFEIDEFALPELLSKSVPRILLLLNLSRDQLDRYGEVDIIFDRWLRALKKSPADFPVVADIEQNEFKKIGDYYKGKVVYFNDSTSFLEKTKLSGKHNAKNLNACLVVCSLMGMDVNKCVGLLSDFNPAYGRGEVVGYKGKSYRILLAKNPASLNNNLDSLSEEPQSYDALYFVLNDNIPDGRDVSWIYDVDPGKISKTCEGRKVFVSGTRCYDMAVRLKYAGVPLMYENISPDPSVVLKMITKEKKAKNIAVLPNYSAMLRLRKIILGRRIL
jgi:lipid II isoglutaminyl synthase (glutamine-hydrolysing)